MKPDRMWRDVELVPAYVIASLLTFAIQWRQLDLPLCGDEADFYAGMVRHFMAHGLNLLRHPGFFEIYHPPFYYAGLGALVSVAGWSLPALRVASVLSSSVLPVAVYALARRGAGLSLSALAAAAVVCSPLYLSQSALLHPDLLAGAFVLLTLGALLSGRWRAAALLFAAACATNGSAPATAPALFYVQARLARPDLRRAAWTFLPGLLLTLAWIAFFLVMTGGVGDLGSSNLFDHDPGAAIGKLVAAWPRKLFLESGRWLLVACLAAGAYARCRRIPIRSWTGIRAQAMLLLLWTQLVLLSFFTFVNERYAAAPIAALYAMGAWALAELPDIRLSRALANLALVGVCGLGLASWLGRTAADGYDMYNASYFDNVRALQRLATDLERNAATTMVFAPWPWSSPLARPELGVVSRPLTVTMTPPADFEWQLRPPRGAIFVFPGNIEPPAPLPFPRALGGLRHGSERPCRSWRFGRGQFNACPFD